MRLYFATLKVLRALDEGPATFSELIRRTGLKATDLRTILEHLEWQGVVVKDGDHYRKVGA